MKPRAFRMAFACVLLSGWAALSAQQPAAAPVVADFGEAVLRNWVQPDYPEAARKAKLEGRVQVEFVVELDGRVSRAQVAESSNEVFNEAALAAVRRWLFDPALEEAKPVVSAMTVPVEFRLAQLKQKTPPISPAQALMPRAQKLTPAKIKQAPEPDYPAELDEQKLPGEVQIEFTVDLDGRVAAPRVQWASHAAFVETALRALEKTAFEPARQGPLAKTATMQYPVEFSSVGVQRAELLAANRITLRADSPDALPQPFVVFEPVYPLDKLLAGDRGAATVDFQVNAQGRTEEVTVAEATAPEYGAALTAAVEAWMLRPAITAGVQVPIKLRVVHEFVPPVAGGVARLAENLKPGASGVGGASGLDRKLKPLWRGFPVYPAALRAERIPGAARIEFIIDREGRARLPRVVSATRDEFGWAAATAISQWVFERPMRKGEPVDVRVSIPVDFPPPAD
jgi:TonB family protein